MSKRIAYVGTSLNEEQLKQLEALDLKLDYLTGDIEDIDEKTLSQVELVLSWSNGLDERFKGLSEINLKWVQTVSAGVDSLDQSWLKDKGITLTTASGIHGYPIRESIFAMLLGINRGVIESVKSQMEGRWNKSISNWVLQGKTMMVWGSGQIGESVAELAKQGFSMKTLGVNRSGRKALHMDEMMLEEEALKRLGEVDVVVAILPLTADTRAKFDTDFFSKMKEGSIFVNMGRGPSVVTDDLMAALKSKEGKPRFAALDVTDPEPLPEGHPLWDLDNIVITPHISGSMDDYMDHVLEVFMKNLKAYIKDGSPSVNVVDYELGY